MIPSSAELDRLIHSPTGWTEFFRGIEREGKLGELLPRLQELPESSIRDARISLILVRLGKHQEAKELVYQHKNCPLAKAWYFAYLVDEGDDSTLRMILQNYRPDWPLRTGLTDLEAKYRAYLTLAVAASALKRVDTARDMFFKAFTIADALEDTHARSIVSFEFARAELYNDNIRAARERFTRLIPTLQKNTGIYNKSVEYLSHILWLENSTDACLPAWSQETLRVLKQREPIARLKTPAMAALPYLIPMLFDLKKLTLEFHAKLPLFHVSEHREQRAALVKGLREAAGDSAQGSEIIGLFAQSIAALAESMEHRPEAIERMKHALLPPVSYVSICNMAYFATLVQVHANLPQVRKTEDVARALSTLRTQFKHLPSGQQEWLVAWMKDFTPTTLYLLAEHIKHLQIYTQSFVIVGSNGAVCGGKKVKRYPKEFMTRHVLGLLAGETIPGDQRHQAHRHRHGVEAAGSPCVIYEPVVKIFSELGNA